MTEYISCPKTIGQWMGKNKNSEIISTKIEINYL